MTKPGSKPANRWLDVQIVIATMAMTFSLFLWNTFAGAQSSLATLSVPEPQISLPPDQGGSQGSGSAAKLNVAPTAVPADVNTNPAQPQPQPQSFGTILLGGSAPQTSSVSAGSVGGAPVPVTTTRSSRP